MSPSWPRSAFCEKISENINIPKDTIFREFEKASSSESFLKNILLFKNIFPIILGF